MDKTIAIDPAIMKPAVCIACGGKYFRTVSRYQFYRGFLTQGNSLIAETLCYRCLKCGHIHELDELFPIDNATTKGFTKQE